MANLFDKLKFVTASGCMNEEQSSEKSGNATDTSVGIEPDATMSVQQTAGTTCPSEVSRTNPTASKSDAKSEENMSTKVAPKLKRSHQKTAAKPKKDDKSNEKSSKVSSKKVKTKSTTDMTDLPAAPPKKVAKTEKKKHKTFASRPPDLEEVKQPKAKKAKKSPPKKPVDARPAFEPLTKPFVIPRKKSKDVGLLQEVTLDSREYLKDIQPLVLKQYREVASRGRYLFTKAKMVHNEELSREFLERKKAMKEEGRNDKDLAEHHAFFCVDTESEAIQICQDGILCRGGPTHCLGNSEMGVYLSRYSDIIKRGPMTNDQQGFLIVFKILKGKVKAMPLNYTSAIEPTPNFDSHVAKETDIDVLKLGPIRAFDHTQIYIYEYGELDLEKRPKQICPYAVIQFVYKDPHKKQAEREPLASIGTVPQRSPVLTPSAPSPVTTPVRQVTPTTKETLPTVQTVDAKDYKVHCKHCFKLWRGNLVCKGHRAFTGLIVSYSSPIVPRKLPEKLDLKTEIPLHKLKSTFPSPIFKPALPIVTRQKEVTLEGSHYMYTEMKQMKDKDEEEDAKKAKKRSMDSLMKYLLSNSMALKIPLDSSRALYLLPTSKFTDELGITTPGYPIVLHVLFVSQMPTVSHVTGKGIHLPKDFKLEPPLAKPLKENPNRLRDMRRTMLGFFSEQKSLALGESQKQCRVEMQPEYRTSQSVYSSNYTGIAATGLPIPTAAGRARVPSGGSADPGFSPSGIVPGQFPRQHQTGLRILVPISPQSESGSSQHSTSPLYEPDSPHALMDPRLKALPTKRLADPRLAVAYTSTSQIDPRLARSMGVKPSTQVDPTMQQVPPKVPAVRTDQQLELTAAQGQRSGEPRDVIDKYAHLQESAVEYAKRRAAEGQKKQDFSNPILQGSSQLLEFHGMMKQQQQVLDLQKQMKQLRETRRNSAEGLVKATSEEVDMAYQAKIAELQRTLQSLLQQRQQLASTGDGTLKQSPRQGASDTSNVSDLLSQVKRLGDQGTQGPSDPRKATSSDTGQAAPLDPRKRVPSDPRRLAATKPVVLRQISDTSQSSDSDSNKRAEVPNLPYEVVMEIESPDPEEQMASPTFISGLETKSDDVPHEKPVAPPTKDFGSALAVMDTAVKKSYPEKFKKKPVPSEEKLDGSENTTAKADLGDDATPGESPQEPREKTAVELLWEKSQEDSMTDASEDLYVPEKPTPETPTNEDVSKLASETQESPVSPIREANEMKDFLNSAVETPARLVAEDKGVADKGKGVAEKGQVVAEKGKTAAEKEKTVTEKGKTAAVKKIKSANDMKSYLNKQLQELEKEKEQRGKRKKGSKEKEDEDPQTIEEIDAMIKKLHKLKHAKLKAEQQQKQKKKSTASDKKTKAKVSKAKVDAKENTKPSNTGKAKGPREPVCGEAPLTRHWGRNAGTVHGIILGPGSNRPVRHLAPVKPQVEDKRKVRMTIDGKKIAVDVIVNEDDIKNRKDGLDGSAESCVMYMLHHRFTIGDDKEEENADDCAFVDSVLEAVYSLNSLQQVSGNKERPRKVVEMAVKLEKRKQLSEERMSFGSDEGETITEDVFSDLDDAQGVSIKLGEESGKADKPLEDVPKEKGNDKGQQEKVSNVSEKGDTGKKEEGSRQPLKSHNTNTSFKCTKCNSTNKNKQCECNKSSCSVCNNSKSKSGLTECSACSNASNKTLGKSPLESPATSGGVMVRGEQGCKLTQTTQGKGGEIITDSTTKSKLAYAQTDIPIDIGQELEEVGVWPPLLAAPKRPAKTKTGSNNQASRLVESFIDSSRDPRLARKQTVDAHTSSSSSSPESMEVDDGPKESPWRIVPLMPDSAKGVLKRTIVNERALNQPERKETEDNNSQQTASEKESSPKKKKIRISISDYKDKKMPKQNSLTESDTLEDAPPVPDEQGTPVKWPATSVELEFEQRLNMSLPPPVQRKTTVEPETVKTPAIIEKTTVKDFEADLKEMEAFLQSMKKHSKEEAEEIKKIIESSKEYTGVGSEKGMAEKKMAEEKMDEKKTDESEKSILVDDVKATCSSNQPPELPTKHFVPITLGTEKPLSTQAVLHTSIPPEQMLRKHFVPLTFGTEKPVLTQAVPHTSNQSKDMQNEHLIPLNSSMETPVSSQTISSKSNQSEEMPRKHFVPLTFGTEKHESTQSVPHMSIQSEDMSKKHFVPLTFGTEKHVSTEALPHTSNQPEEISGKHFVPLKFGTEKHMSTQTGPGRSIQSEDMSREHLVPLTFGTEKPISTQVVPHTSNELEEMSKKHFVPLVSGAKKHGSTQAVPCISNETNDNSRKHLVPLTFSSGKSNLSLPDPEQILDDINETETNLKAARPPLTRVGINKLQRPEVQPVIPKSTVKELMSELEDAVIKITAEKLRHCFTVKGSTPERGEQKQNEAHLYNLSPLAKSGHDMATEPDFQPFFKELEAAFKPLHRNPDSTKSKHLKLNRQYLPKSISSKEINITLQEAVSDLCKNLPKVISDSVQMASLGIQPARAEPKSQHLPILSKFGIQPIAMKPNPTASTHELLASLCDDIERRTEMLESLISQSKSKTQDTSSHVALSRKSKYSTEHHTQSKTSPHEQIYAQEVQKQHTPDVRQRRHEEKHKTYHASGERSEKRSQSRVHSISKDRKSADSIHSTRDRDSKETRSHTRQEQAPSKDRYSERHERSYRNHGSRYERSKQSKVQNISTRRHSPDIADKSESSSSKSATSEMPTVSKDRDTADIEQSEKDSSEKSERALTILQSNKSQSVNKDKESENDNSLQPDSKSDAADSSKSLSTATSAPVTSTSKSTTDSMGVSIDTISKLSASGSAADDTSGPISKTLPSVVTSHAVSSSVKSVASISTGSSKPASSSSGVFGSKTVTPFKISFKPHLPVVKTVQDTDALNKESHKHHESGKILATKQRRYDVLIGKRKDKEKSVQGRMFRKLHVAQTGISSAFIGQRKPLAKRQQSSDGAKSPSENTGIGSLSLPEAPVEPTKDFTSDSGGSKIHVTPNLDSTTENQAVGSIIKTSKPNSGGEPDEGRKLGEYGSPDPNKPHAESSVTIPGSPSTQPVIGEYGPITIPGKQPTASAVEPQKSANESGGEPNKEDISSTQAKSVSPCVANKSSTVGGDHGSVDTTKPSGSSTESPSSGAVSTGERGEYGSFVEPTQQKDLNSEPKSDSQSAGTDSISKDSVSTIATGQIFGENSISVPRKLKDSITELKSNDNATVPCKTGTTPEGQQYENEKTINPTTKPRSDEKGNATILSTSKTVSPEEPCGENAGISPLPKSTDLTTEPQSDDHHSVADQSKAVTLTSSEPEYNEYGSVLKPDKPKSMNIETSDTAARDKGSFALESVSNVLQSSKGEHSTSGISKPQDIQTKSDLSKISERGEYGSVVEPSTQTSKTELKSGKFRDATANDQQGPISSSDRGEYGSAFDSSKPQDFDKHSSDAESGCSSALKKPSTVSSIEKLKQDCVDNAEANLPKNKQGGDDGNLNTSKTQSTTTEYGSVIDTSNAEKNHLEQNKESITDPKHGMSGSVAEPNKAQVPSPELKHKEVSNVTNTTDIRSGKTESADCNITPDSTEVVSKTQVQSGQQDFVAVTMPNKSDAIVPIGKDILVHGSADTATPSVTENIGSEADFVQYDKAITSKKDASRPGPQHRDLGAVNRTQEHSIATDKETPNLNIEESKNREGATDAVECPVVPQAVEKADTITSDSECISSVAADNQATDIAEDPANRSVEDKATVIAKRSVAHLLEALKQDPHTDTQTGLTEAAAVEEQEPPPPGVAEEPVIGIPSTAMPSSSEQPFTEVSESKSDLEMSESKSDLEASHLIDQNKQHDAHEVESTDYYQPSSQAPVDEYLLHHHYSYREVPFHPPPGWPQPYGHGHHYSPMHANVAPHGPPSWNPNNAEMYSKPPSAWHPPSHGAQYPPSWPPRPATKPRFPEHFQNRPAPFNGPGRAPEGLRPREPRPEYAQPRQWTAKKDFENDGKSQDTDTYITDLPPEEPMELTTVSVITETQTQGGISLPVSSTLLGNIPQGKGMFTGNIQDIGNNKDTSQETKADDVEEYSNRTIANQFKGNSKSDKDDSILVSEDSKADKNDGKSDAIKRPLSPLSKAVAEYLAKQPEEESLVPLEESKQRQSNQDSLLKHIPTELSPNLKSTSPTPLKTPKLLHTSPISFKPKTPTKLKLARRGNVLAMAFRQERKLKLAKTKSKSVQAAFGTEDEDSEKEQVPKSSLTRHATWKRKRTLDYVPSNAENNVSIVELNKQTDFSGKNKERGGHLHSKSDSACSSQFENTSLKAKAKDPVPDHFLPSQNSDKMTSIGNSISVSLQSTDLEKSRSADKAQSSISSLSSVVPANENPATEPYVSNDRQIGGRVVEIIKLSEKNITPALDPSTPIQPPSLHSSSPPPTKKSKVEAENKLNQSPRHLFYVHKSETKDKDKDAVKDFLRSTGGLEFNPNNKSTISNLQHGRDDAWVLIHLGDLPDLHNIPNLLQMKLLECVKFAAYKGAAELKMRKYDELFLGGGIVIPDEQTILSCQPRDLEVLCNLLRSCSQANPDDQWTIMVHSQIVVKLDNMRRSTYSLSQEHENALACLQILKRHRRQKLVTLLQSHACDTQATKASDYLNCTIGLQALHALEKRRCVFLSSIDPRSESAKSFSDIGVEVCSLSAFIRKQSSHHSAAKLGTSTESTSEKHSSQNTASHHGQYRFNRLK